MKKSISFLLLLIALACFCVSAICDGAYRTLSVGSYGNDVLAVKNRMKELGYFSGSNLNNRYTDDTAERVRRFEAACGLPQTGVLTPALQALLFSDAAVASGEKKEAATLPDVADSAYRLIDENASGDDVLRLKEQLKKLGYFTAKAETGAYNETLAKAIRACQEAMGMDPTGIADVALQDALYASPATAGTNAAVPTIAPNGPAKAIDLPELGENGFLADETAAPFIHADRGDGHWYYISQKLYIEIQRLQLPKQKITWFETEIRCAPDTLPQAFLAQGSRLPGHNYLSPLKIADQYNAVFAISDDFYGYRWYNRSKGLKQGVIIRNGEIQAEEPQPANSKKWPYLEILALFQDGSMQVFESDEHTAKEYLEMGVIDTFAFGPILIRDGVINTELYDKSIQRYLDSDPRMAMGCIEPCHYVILSIKGRTSDSNGAPMHWIAERMRSLGCQNALNLDGGGTTALYFMGDVLNKVENSQNLRDLSSMFGFSAE
ncbi:MAG: phosphodiester glycosidase family protein [Clostridia bacterium]|nr:phosphodiester glycosidase family protein [Clostridia bacterium]